MIDHVMMVVPDGAMVHCQVIQFSGHFELIIDELFNSAPTNILLTCVTSEAALH